MTAKKVIPDNTPTKLTVGKDHFKKQLGERLIAGNEMLMRSIITYDALDKAKEDFNEWNSYNSELLKQSFNKEENEYRTEYNQAGASAFFVLDDNPDKLKDFKDMVKSKVDSINRLIGRVDLMKTELPETKYDSPIEKTGKPDLKNVFIVHGHNNEIKINVARTLEKLDLNPIILHEQANEGMTIIEKFEKHSDVGFAVILLTDDDEGKAKTEHEYNKRTRQNVVLELGYFIGKLGRKNVCPLYVKGVELPSDLHGLIYVELDGSETWKIKLVKELKSAGYDVDANKII